MLFVLGDVGDGLGKCVVGGYGSGLECDFWGVIWVSRR